jgi:two-component system chemotaxis response regulator CheB
VTQPIRVLVVDDSSVQRQMLVALLQADPELSVVGTASDGARAIVEAGRLKPDVITMDLRMPGMDGLSAAEAIMARAPVPILLVTASVSRDDQRLVVRAFSAGILAIVGKPSMHALDVHEDFRRMVKGVSKVRLIARRPARLPPVSAPPPPLPTEQRLRTRQSPAVMPARVHRLDVIGIASSTGGPQVLELILSKLPANFPVPILVVQHIAKGFASSLVDWLASRCALSVRLAVSGASLESGVWVADERHLRVVGGRTLLGLDPPVSGHRPSGTVLFRSLAEAFGSSALGVILTGMGEDGAVGLQALHDAGGVTIAQDEHSSVIHGMPGAAMALGAVDFALPPEEIAQAILEFSRRGRSMLEW